MRTASPIIDELILAVVAPNQKRELSLKLGLPTTRSVFIEVNHKDAKPHYIDQLGQVLGLTVRKFRLSDIVSSSIGGQEENVKKFFTALPENSLVVIENLDRIFSNESRGNVRAFAQAALSVLAEQIEMFPERNQLLIAYSAQQSKVAPEALEVFDERLVETRQNTQQTQALWALAVSDQEQRAARKSPYSQTTIFPSEVNVEQLAATSGTISFYRMTQLIQTTLRAYVSAVLKGEIKESTFDSVGQLEFEQILLQEVRKSCK